MREIVLTYPTEYGSEEIIFKSEKISFGRGSEAVHRFEDDGLSRLHASIIRKMIMFKSLMKIPATELLSMAKTIRSRLGETTKRLKTKFPVYLVFTHADAIEGRRVELVKQ